MNPELGQKLIMAIVMTMMLTPFVFRFLDRLTPKLLRDQADEEQPSAEQPEAAKGHVVLLGMLLSRQLLL